MKLEKFKTKNSKKKIMIIGSIVLILLVTIIVVYRSFAFFEEKQEFNVIKGSIPDQNYDVKLSYVIEDKAGNKKICANVPENKNYEVSITCNNGATGIWNYKEWGPDIRNLSQNHTKCDIYFLEIDEPIIPEEGSSINVVDTKTFSTSINNGTLWTISEVMDESLIGKYALLSAYGSKAYTAGGSLSNMICNGCTILETFSENDTLFYIIKIDKEQISISGNTTGAGSPSDPYVYITIQFYFFETK